VSRSPAITLDDLRRFAAGHALAQHGSLRQAIEQLGFVQADPIRAPARAQDLILRLRVPGYAAGDLEVQYEALPIEEDFCINYGFMPRDAAMLLHPRKATRVWTQARWRQAQRVLEHIRAQGPAHPRELAQALGTKKATNAWGGQSSDMSQLLDGMQYRSLLRVARRDAGTRIYAALDLPHAQPAAQEAAWHWLCLLVKLYAPVTERGLRLLASMLVRGCPQLREAVQASAKLMLRQLPQTRVQGITWLWPEGLSLHEAQCHEQRQARLLAPFDPLVWDRNRFEQLWGWAYRFEAYTPAAKRKLGYYALPLLVGTQVVGWANLQYVGADPQAKRLHAEIGFVQSMAAYPYLRQDTEADLQHFARFLGTTGGDPIITRHPSSAW
jgi:uncharacterized protein